MDGDGTFVSRGIDPEPLTLRARVGLSVYPTDNVKITVRCDLEAWEDFRNQIASTF